jgi:hypothetical protein
MWSRGLLIISLSLVVFMYTSAIPALVSLQDFFHCFTLLSVSALIKRHRAEANHESVGCTAVVPIDSTEICR